MASPVEQMLFTFMQRLRSRRHGLAVLVLLGWVVLAEGLLVVHRIDHAGAGDSAACVLCSAADQQAAAAAVTPPPRIAVCPDSIESFVGIPVEPTLTVCYHSRAPPLLLRS